METEVEALAVVATAAVATVAGAQAAEERAETATAMVMVAAVRSAVASMVDSKAGLAWATREGSAAGPAVVTAAGFATTMAADLKLVEATVRSAWR